MENEYRGGLNRRELIRSSLLLAGAPYLCCSTADVPAASISYERGMIVIDLRQAGDLRRTGSAGKIVDEQRSLNLIIAHPEKKRFVALDRPCTHSGGPVAYSHRRRTVQCTCWGHAEFDLNGTVLSGPAPRPLRTYDVRLSGSRLEILLERKA